MGSQEPPIKQPDIFEYYDYRLYLKVLVAFKRQTSAAFSHRFIVQKAGFSSPTALKHVIDGKRNLSLEAANRFANALHIDGIPRHYFLTLVLFNQSEVLAEKERYLNELLQLKQAESPSKLGVDHFDILAQWYHLAIREIIALPDFKQSPKWISKVLLPHITPFEASQSLLLLKKLGMVVKANGKLHPAERTIATDAEVYSVKAAEFHRQMIRLGAEAITSVPRNEREISGTLLRISRGDAETIKMMLREFRKKLLTIAANSGAADQVYQLNFQFFPLVLTDRTRSSIEQDEGE